MKRNRILIALITSLLTLVSCNTEKHEHSFSSDWTSNDTAHWHQSTCEHSDVKDSYGEHKDLNYDGYCDICEYLTDLELSKHQHTFSNIYSMDATHHWHESNCGHPVEPIDKEEHQFVNGKCSKCDYLDSCSSLWTPISLDEMKEIIYNHFSTYQCIKDGELLSRIDNDEIPLMNSYGEKGTIKGISNQNIILADGSIRKVQENNSYEVISDKTNCKLFYSFLNNNIIDTSIYLSKLTDDTANFSEWDDKSGQYINDTCSLQESEIINYCSNYLFHVFDFFFTGYKSLVNVYNDEFNVYEDDCLTNFATTDTLYELNIDDDQTFSFYKTDDGKYVLISSFEILDEYVDNVSSHFYRDYITGNISGTVNAQVKHIVVFGDYFIDEDYVETHFESNFIMHDNDDKEGYALYDEFLRTVFIDEADFSNIDSQILD